MKNSHKGTKTLDLTKHVLIGLATGEALYPRFYTKRQTQQALYGLRRYNFIRRVKGRSRQEYILTPKGKERLQEIIIDEVKIKNPKYWDGKWRLVMYDFPIRLKKVRNVFRWKLKDLGFIQFQKSAWIYPYPCEREILFVADFYGVRRHIQILEISKVFQDTKIKKHFCL